MNVVSMIQNALLFNCKEVKHFPSQAIWNQDHIDQYTLLIIKSFSRDLKREM